MTGKKELLPVTQEPPLTLHVKFVDVEDGASLYVYAGNGSPPQPGDSSEHYPLDQMPMALRFVAEHLRVECEPHVTEDMVRICADAAEIIEGGSDSQAELVEVLTALAGAEKEYRSTHDYKGDGHIETGRAWDRMRRASDRAIALIARIEGPAS